MVWKYNLNPVLLDIDGLEIRYYGLFYLIGLVLAFFFIRYLAKQRKLKLDDDDVMDLMVYLAAGILLGGRIFYFVFYNFGGLVQSPLEIFKVWHGGMSFHGGLIGVAVASFIYCKLKKIHFYDLADIVVFPAALALALGRIGNFINGELYGRPTTLPWGIDFGDGVARHPSQLYESAKNLVNFGILWLFKDKNLPKGFLFWMFVFNYGVMRFFIEFVREPDAQLGFVLFNTFSMGQVLSFCMVVVGGVMLGYLWKKK